MDVSYLESVVSLVHTIGKRRMGSGFGDSVKLQLLFQDARNDMLVLMWDESQ